MATYYFIIPFSLPIVTQEYSHGLRNIFPNVNEGKEREGRGKKSWVGVGLQKVEKQIGMEGRKKRRKEISILGIFKYNATYFTLKII